MIRIDLNDLASIGSPYEKHVKANVVSLHRDPTAVQTAADQPGSAGAV